MAAATPHSQPQYNGAALAGPEGDAHPVRVVVCENECGCHPPNADACVACAVPEPAAIIDAARGCPGWAGCLVVDFCDPRLWPVVIMTGAFARAGVRATFIKRASGNRV